jgi:hypothetical protein
MNNLFSEEVKNSIEKEFTKLKNSKLSTTKETQKRRNLITSIKNHGGQAFAIENICFSGMADIYGETIEGEPFWIELKVNYNKLSEKQLAFFALVKIQKYTITFFKKTIVVVDITLNKTFTFSKLKNVTEYILKLPITQGKK